ncbi:MAG: DUF2062 domain-containing protein, partial [Gammaproteobacteria bacterium]
MIVAAPLSLLFRVNLPVTIACVWVTNPLTMAPMFIFAYRIGSWITGDGARLDGVVFEPSFQSVSAVFGEIWWPLAVGCAFCGVCAAAVGNVTVRWLWRGYVLYRRRQRRRERLTSPR